MRGRSPDATTGVQESGKEGEEGGRQVTELASQGAIVRFGRSNRNRALCPSQSESDPVVSQPLDNFQSMADELSECWDTPQRAVERAVARAPDESSLPLEVLYQVLRDELDVAIPTLEGAQFDAGTVGGPTVAIQRLLVFFSALDAYQKECEKISVTVCVPVALVVKLVLEAAATASTGEAKLARESDPVQLAILALGNDYGGNALQNYGMKNYKKLKDARCNEEYKSYKKRHFLASRTLARNEVHEPSPGEHLFGIGQILVEQNRVMLVCKSVGVAVRIELMHPNSAAIFCTANIARDLVLGAWRRTHAEIFAR